MKPGMKLTILLVTAVCFWSGLFYFASCSDHPEKRAVEIAERALKATIDNPESIKSRASVRQIRYSARNMSIRMRRLHFPCT